jgi:hypothetical protein
MVPSPNDPQELAAHKKKEVKAKKMYDALVGLYQSRNTGWKLILRHQLKVVEMSSSDIVSSYLMRITPIRDHLATIGEAVDDTELVNVALNGFFGSWEPFVQGICARETFPPFDKLWTDCMRLG